MLHRIKSIFYDTITTGRSIENIEPACQSEVGAPAGRPAKPRQRASRQAHSSNPFDVIFNSVNNICTVDESWFDHATQGEFAGLPVRFLSAQDLIWCKSYVQNRERHDGADINHVILKFGRNLNWERLLKRLDAHWHLLLSQLIAFQFVYPSDFHDVIPRWLFDELMKMPFIPFSVHPA